MSVTTAAPPRNRVLRKRVVVLALTIAALAVAVVLSLAVGTRTVPLADVWRVLGQPDDSVASDVVRGLRVPRTLLAIGVGAALGMAGALMQALTRNPLAEPGLLGVNLGAATAVVSAIAFLGITDPAGYVWFAFLGAAVTSAAVFAVGGVGRNATPERQVLAGVSITAVLGAYIWGVLVTDAQTFNQYRFWDVGSLADREAGTVVQVMPFILAGIALALSLGRRLNVLGMGDETAVALGAHPGRVRLLGIVAITLLCGAATAAVGPIWFLGLAVPYVARLLTGPDHRWVLIYSMVVGPTVFLLADIVGRVLVAPSELAVGVVTAFVGAPVFLAICRRRRLGVL